MRGRWISAATVVVGLCGAAFGQLEAEWVRHYDGPTRRSDAAQAVAAGPNGSVSVTGGSDGIGSDEDFATIRYDAAGNELWSARYNGPANGIDVAVAVGVDDAGNTYVTGSSWNSLRPSGSEWDYVTIKYGPAGAEEWVRRYNGPGNWSDTPTAMEVDGAGNVYIAGFAFKEPDEFNRYATHFHVLKYDTDGNVVWEHLLDQDRHLGAGARDIALDAQGNVYATGVMNAGDPWNNQDDTLTVKIDPGGAIVFQDHWNSGGFNQGLDDSYTVATDGQGNTYVGAQFMSDEGNRHRDTAILKYGPAGDLLWEWRNTGMDRADAAWEIVVDGAGNVYAAGGWDNATDVDGYLFALTPDGAERWRRVYDGTGAWDYQEAIWAQLTPAGEIAVGLDWQYDDAAGYDFTIVRVRADGTMVDQSRFDTGSTSDTFVSLDGFDMAADGAIYIAGYSFFSTTVADFTTVRVRGAGGCLADLDGSGVLTLADFTAFRNLYVAGDLRADFDGDGTLSLSDFVGFRNAYVAGCR